MRRSSLLLGALLLSARPAAAQFGPATPARTTLRPQQAAPDSAATPAAAEQPTVLTERLTPFDNARAEIVWSSKGWRLAAGEVILKDFGRREADARQALRLVQNLHLNQFGTVGEPVAVMEYWLSDGQAPVGLVAGLRPLAIDTATLKAEQVQGQWCVRDRQRALFNFGLRGDEAQKALGVLKKYGFTQAIVIGSPAPTMMVMTGNPARPSPAPRAPQLAATDATAALGGVVPSALPPLRNATRQPNEPVIAFGQGQPQDHLTTRQTSFLRGPQAPTIGLSERVTFDYRQVQLRQESGSWKLAAGSRVLANFGNSERDAKQALSAVQHFRLTEQCLVGRPEPVCSYFLAQGQAPRGVPFGLEVRPLERERLAVQQTDGKWALCSSGRAVLQFGGHPEEAKYMLDAIQRHGFDHVARLGPEDGGMTLLMKAH